MQITTQLSGSRIIFYLILIIIISLGLKLYTVDFSIPPHTDDLGYILNSMQYNEGDFFLSQKKHPGWSLVLAPFMAIVNSDNFLDYGSTARILSITISIITIIPMYILARRFFDEKYSLVASSLFAFEPHLNYNSGGALSEPLLILVLILSMNFILSDKTKYHYIAFIFTGFCWWVRLEAIYPMIAIIFIYFIAHRAKSNYLRKFFLCMIFLLIIISPLFVQRYLQFDDPFYVWYSGTILSDDYAELLTTENKGITDFVEKHGILGLMDRLATGLMNLFNILIRISFPYLFILIPFGILFSLRPVDQKLKNIKANWIMIIAIISIIMIPFAIIDERRWIFPIFPFLIILSTIPIQRITNYGLNTFSFNEKQKSIFLVTAVSIVLLLSCTFTVGIGEFGYGLPNSALEREKIKFTEHLVENFDGRILRDAVVNDYLAYINITSDDNDFKTFKSPRGKNPYPDLYEPGKVVRMNVYGKTVEELVTNGETISLKYIGILEKGSYLFPFLNDLYYNEENYPYMKKVFDSDEMGYEQFKIKVFEIDYKNFHELND
jgi:4-amino-4-deoxy-L-arabinose transferase-like glycosyltransferase